MLDKHFFALGQFCRYAFFVSIFPVLFLRADQSLIETFSSVSIGDSIVGDSDYIPENDSFENVANGSDLNPRWDNFQFIYYEVVGDSSIEAQVSSMVDKNDISFAGVMFRADLSPDSPMVSSLTSRLLGSAAISRIESGGTRNKKSIEGYNAPVFVRVVRKGNVFSSYVSRDGVGWKLIESSVVDMPSQVFVGLALSADLNALATYNDVEVFPLSIASIGNKNTRVMSRDIPQTMLTSGTETVRIEMRNLGDRPWVSSEGFHLAYTGTEPNPWEVDQVSISPDVVVETGESYVFDFDLKGPDIPGWYALSFQMSDGRSLFGEMADDMYVEVLNPIFATRASSVSAVSSPVSEELLYRFLDGSGGVVADLSGGGNDGSLVNFSNENSGEGTSVGGSGWTSGGMLNFDGVDDYVSTGYNASNLYGGSFTLEAIVTHNDAGRTYSPIFGSSHSPYDGNQIMFLGKESGTSNLTFNLAGLSATNFGPTAISDGELHHVAVVFDDASDEVRLYFDYALIGTETGVSGTLAAANELWIGAVGHASEERWDGFIGSARITKSALAIGGFLTLDSGGQLEDQVPTIADSGLSERSASEGFGWNYDVSSFFDDDNPIAASNFAAQRVTDMSGGTVHGDGSLPAWANFANGSFDGTPLAGSAGDYFFKVTYTDSASQSISSVFKLEVRSDITSPVSDELLYRFLDGSGGVVTDLSGGGNDGSLVNFSNENSGAGTSVGGSGWTSGGMLNFDGVDDYVSTGYNASDLYESSFTMEAIVTHNNSGSTFSPIVGSSHSPYNGNQIVFFGKSHGTSKITYNFGELDAREFGPTNIGDGELHHVAVVFDDAANEIRLYFDYVLLGVHSGISGKFNVTNDLWIGGVGHASVERWDGLIGSVRISKSALGVAEFLSLESSGKAINLAPVVVNGGLTEDSIAEGSVWNYNVSPYFSDDESIALSGFQVVRVTDMSGTTQFGDGSLPLWLAFENAIFDGEPTSGTSGDFFLKVTYEDSAQQSVSSVIKLVVSSDTVPNSVPSIGEIADQVVVSGVSAIDLDFSIEDAETPEDDLVLSATSSNEVLVPISNVAFGGSGTARTVSISPVHGELGSAIIRVTVSDGESSSFEDFTVSVVDTYYDEFNSTALDSSWTFFSPSDASGYSIADGALRLFVPNGINHDVHHTIEVPRMMQSIGDVEFDLEARFDSYREYPGVEQNTQMQGFLVEAANGQYLAFSLLHNGTKAMLSIRDSNSSGWIHWENFSAGDLNPYLRVERNGSSWTVRVSSDGQSWSVVDAFSHGLPVSRVGVFAGNAVMDPEHTAIVAYYKNSALSVSLPDDDHGGDDSNNSPFISAIEDQAIHEGTGTGDLTFTIGDSETDPDSLTLSAASSDTVIIPNSGIVLGGFGGARTVSVTPENGEVGSATVTVTVGDGVNSVSESFVVTVAEKNETPTISAIDSQSILENMNTGFIDFIIGDLETPVDNLILLLASTDTALIPLSNIVLGGSGANRTVTVTPLPNQSGSSTITLTVDDGANTATSSFIVAVSDVNDAPTISVIDSLTIMENGNTGALAFIIGDSETDPTGLSLEIESSNTGLVPISNIDFGGSGASRTVTIFPVSGLSGSTTITLTVGDGMKTAVTSFVLTVTNVNEAPTISTIVSQTILEDGDTGPLSFTVADSQTDAGGLTLDAVSSNVDLVSQSGLVFGGNGINRTITVTPNADASGSATITVTVGDGDLNVSTNFVVSVSAVNDVPLASSDSFETSEDTPFVGVLIGSDVEGGVLVFEMGTEPNNGEVALEPDGSIVYTPTLNYNGSDSFTFTVFDGLDRSLPATVSFDVISVNDLPSLDTTIVDRVAISGKPFELVFEESMVTDPDEETSLIWSLEQYPNWISFDATERRIGGTPTLGDVGDHSITLLVVDSEGGELRDTFLISVSENQIDFDRTNACGYSTWWIDSSGSATAWGNNLHLQVDPNSIKPNGEYVIDQAFVVKKSVSSKSHSLLLLSDGRILSQGDNQFSQLGGVLEASDLSVSPALQEPVLDIAIGDGYSLAVTDSGNLYAWGLNRGGYIFESGSDILTVPTAHNGSSGIDVANVATGNGFVIVLDDNGNLWSWGVNDKGQLGVGNRVSSAMAEQIVLPEPIVEFCVGDSHTLALGASGAVYGFGSNAFGQLGLGTSEFLSPAVIATGIAKIETTKWVSVLLTNEGSILTAGGNLVELGRVYDGAGFLEVEMPVSFIGATDIKAGYHHVIVVSAAGDTVGWGDNSFDQLGSSQIGEFFVSPIVVTPSL